MSVTKNCNASLKVCTPVSKDWGISYTTDTEIDAMRIAYVHRNAKNGVKVEQRADSRYMVIVWNEKAKAMGCDV